MEAIIESLGAHMTSSIAPLMQVLGIHVSPEE